MGLMYAAIVLTPGGVISWLVVGLIAGWLAGLVMKGSGYGMLGDIIVGLIGSFLGGLLVGFFVEGSAEFWGSIVVAFIGACVLIALVRLDQRPPARCGLCDRRSCPLRRERTRYRLPKRRIDIMATTSMCL